MSEMKNIQGGIYDCGKDGYARDGFWKSKDHTIYFPKVYKNTPTVQLSIQLINDDSPDDDNEFGLELVRVTNRYFTIRCKAYYEHANNNLVASWMSAPKF